MTPDPTRAAESRIIDRTEREIAAAIESLTERYPSSMHTAIYHAARIALGNAPERWHHG